MTADSKLTMLKKQIAVEYSISGLRPDLSTKKRAMTPAMTCVTPTRIVEIYELIDELASSNIIDTKVNIILQPLSC